MSGEMLRAETHLVDEWVRPVVGGGRAIRVGRVADPDAPDAICLTLLDVVPFPAARRGATPAPLQLRARYLITVDGGTPADQRQCLADLAFGASLVSRVELDSSPPLPELWLALGIPARPALVASIAVQRERPARRVPRVREPLVTRWSPSRPLAGVVLGPGDVPIAGALVEVDGSPLSTYSNHRGEFAFPSVPGAEPPPTLVVSAKGTLLRVRVAEGDPGDSVLIRVPLSES